MNTNNEVVTTTPESLAAPRRQEADLGFHTPYATQRGQAGVKKALTPRHSLLESLDATRKEWLTSKILKEGADAYDRLNGELDPFKADPDFDLQRYVAHSDHLLSLKDWEWLGSKDVQSADEADIYLNRLAQSKANQAIMGDHPVASFFGLAVDPVYVATAATTFGVGTAAGVGRLGMAAAMAGSEMGTYHLEDRYSPTDVTGYVLAGGLGALGGAVSARLPRKGAKEITPDAPTKQPEPRREPTADQPEPTPTQTPEEAAKGVKEEMTATAGQGQTVQTVDPTTGKVRTDTPEGAWSAPKVREERLGEITAADGKPITIEGLGKSPEGLPYRFQPQGATARTSAYANLTQLIELPNVSAEVKTIARQLLDWGGDQLKQVPVTWGQGMRRGVLGRYSPSDHRIQMASKKRNLDDSISAGATLLHESVHALTALKFRVGLMADASTAHGKLARDFQALYKDIRQNYYRKNPEGKDRRMDYALSNADELFAALFDNSSSVWKHLNDLEVSRSVKDKLDYPTLRAKVYDMVRRILGLDIKQGNALAHALGLSEEIIRTPTRIPLLTDAKTGKPLNSPTTVDVRDLNAVVTRTSQEMDRMANEGSRVPPKNLKERAGQALAWNLFKTAHKLSPEFANKWLSDPLATNAGDNITASNRAIRAELTDLEVSFHRELLQYMANEGVGGAKRIFKPREARAAQAAIERKIKDVLEGWDDITARGGKRPEATTPIEKLAEKHNEAMKHAAELGVKAGLFTEDILKRDGYFRRKFNYNTIRNWMETNAHHFSDGEAGARKAIEEGIARNFRGMGDMDAKGKLLLARAVVDRVIQSGEFVDISFRGHMGMEAVAEVRKSLTRLDVPTKDINRLVKFLEGKVNEAGKASYQKGRLDLDMTGTFHLPDQGVVRIGDMLDSNLSTNLASYLDDVAGRVAMSEHGIKTVADIDKARQDFVKNAKTDKQRREAANLFDNILNATLGRPVGEEMHDALRITGIMTQTISLRNSGFWQVTEFASMMQRYGALVGYPKMLKEVFGSFTGMAKVLDSPEHARSLQGILSRNSYNELRIKPMIDKLDDGFLVNDNSFLDSMRSAQQYVYIVNGMSYVQRRQSVAAANLVTDTLERAARGDVRAREFFNKYGIDNQTLDDLARTFDQHGHKVDNWDAGIWEKVRSPLQTVMDEDVLRARTGEMPEIAQFSSVGKVLFTFRSFTLSAHNKILANKLANDDVKALAIFLSFQFALSAMMTQAANVSTQGELITDPKEWAAKSASMMGGLGLFTEFISLATGQSNQFGSPFLIAADKGARLAGQVGSGDLVGGSRTVAENIPLLSLIPLTGAAIKLLYGD